MDWYKEVTSSQEDKESASGKDWYKEMVVSPSTKEAWRKAVPLALQRSREAAELRGDLPVQSVPDKGAGALDLIAAGTADDPMKQIEYLSRQRFPNLSPEQAMARYGMQDGQIFYKGDKGLYYEAPTMGDRVLMHLSKALPIGAGIGAGVATAPMWAAGPAGAAGSAAITTASAGAGEEARQMLGKYLTGDPVSHGEAGKEAAFAGAGELIGGFISKLLGRGVAKDISRLDPQDVQTLQSLGRKYGIDLTPAELTNVPSLKAQQKALSNITDSADTMGDFYAARASQVDDAVNGILDRISTVDSAETAGELVRSAARNAMKDVAEQRAAYASPIYKRAFAKSPEVDVDGVVQYIDGELMNAKGSIKTALQKARRLIVEKAGEEEVTDTSLVGLHNAKLALDDMIGTARESGIGNVTKGKLIGVKNRLLESMDTASPEYRQARGIFADLSPEVSKVREGVVGIIADLPDTRLQQVAAKLFNPKVIGPRVAKEARTMLRAADPEGWQAIKRAWLQEQWDTASKSFATTGNLNRGSKFRALLIGDKQRQRLLHATLEPDEYQAIDEISRVLEASGRVKVIGSDTAWNQELMKIQRDEAGGALSAVAKTVRVMSWPKIVQEWATEKNMAKIASRTADIITSPNAMSELKALQQVSPTSARAAVLTAHLLGLSGAAGVDTLKDQQ